MPLGEKDMGGWKMRIYTPEQQARLHVDEEGRNVTPEAGKTAEGREQGEVLVEPVKAPPSKMQSMIQAVKSHVKDMTPHEKRVGSVLLLLIGIIGLACLCGACSNRRGDALSGEYAKITASQDTLMKDMGSEEQI